MFKLTKLTLLAAIAVALPLSFASCDEGKIVEQPTKLLPASISVVETIKYNGSSLLRKSKNNYTFSYNDKNQLIKLKNVDQTNTIAEHSFAYDDAGRLITLNDMRGDYPINATYMYDEKAGTVTATWDKIENETLHINKEGLPQSNKHINSNLYQTYSYDSYSNLTKVYDYEKTTSEYEGAKSISIYEETKEYAYDAITFSPFQCLTLPAWFYTAMPRSGVQLKMPFEEGMTGVNLLSFMESSIAMTSNNEKTEGVVTQSLEISVKQKQGNYPTEMKSVMIEKEDGDEVSTTTRTYTITYK